MKKLVKFAFAAGLATMAFFFTNTNEATSLTQYLGRWECVDQPFKTSQMGEHRGSFQDGNMMQIGCSRSWDQVCWEITSGSLNVYDDFKNGPADFWDTLKSE